jgi:paraquat-inducible protein B
MSDAVPRTGIAEAVTRRSRRIQAIWLIPFLAVALGIWLAWQTISKRGPTITISFQTAEGLQAGQSPLKYKDITLGTVKGLALTPDRERVIVTVQTTSEATDLLDDQAIFWVVKPRLFAGNISGLDTLLSGAYIGMRPGTGTGKRQHEFVGREDPPVLSTNVPGRGFLLKASRLGSISVGSPIYYRDLSVGEVLGWDIAKMAESVTIHAFVRSPFDTYVNDQTRFWNASGVSVKLGGTGVEVQLESLRALLLGGIAFDGPGATDLPASAADHEFPLFPDHDAANSADYSRKIDVLAYFPGTVRGLAAGSDVVLRGMKVGQVTSVNLAYDPAKDDIVAPVRFEFQPERILGPGGKQIFSSVEAAANEMVRRGLRARLESANLITGQQMVSLVFLKDAPPAEARFEGNVVILPTTGSGGHGD